MDRVVIVRAGEGTAMTARGSALRFKALGADTDRRFSLFEREVPVGARRPAAHRHPGTSEAFYVLDGTLALHVEDVDHRIERGGFALVPAGVAHTFGNGGPEVLRVLIVHAPALDLYFRELDALDRSGRLDPQSERELMRRHGLEPA